MVKFSGFPFKKTSLLCVAIGGLTLFSADVLAQEENSPRVTDKPVIEDQPSVNEATSPFLNTAGKTTNVKPTNGINTVKRDLPAGGMMQEKELRKNESPSTLSFNIFLYIVDRFKQD
ncbi:hypothetical protein CLV31_11190 [Algoriphagus aquaeductus]|uniref:Uncharacterized protein n=1 Tax=Algoriphagus aquaeductus TaxID=475299 RepID=A0A326RPF2_9BACT|nr:MULTISPECIES: hypothetical protein [Algoriphagus]PZV80924.1 hypothetical protein CLV31_11190 [Algoriphagus aquaeductus]